MCRFCHCILVKIYIEHLYVILTYNCIILYLNAWWHGSHLSGETARRHGSLIRTAARVRRSCAAVHSLVPLASAVPLGDIAASVSRVVPPMAASASVSGVHFSASSNRSTRDTGMRPSKNPVAGRTNPLPRKTERRPRRMQAHSLPFLSAACSSLLGCYSKSDGSIGLCLHLCL